ncbi:MAG: hypothetical protein HYX92_05415 [Chloroflexi bacterium]|nr:hypothetical protein [Chloroflexota bacterium]
MEATASRFELIGARLKDANEDMGPLFGQGPPQILAAGQRGWRDIATVVVGEEGAGRHKWRTQFSPEPTLTVQELPSELAARGCGWYFLRFYDTDDDLVESMDFRFLTSLMDIRTPKSSPLPSKDGHHATRIEFLHDLNCSVQHSGELSAGIHIERSDERTAVTIPPDPLCDLTRWRVCTAVGPSLEVAALVERVWWAIAEEDNQPTEWGDRPVTLCREDFRATSRKAVWIRFPRKRWTNGVLLGFAASDARRFEVRVTEEVTSIPLRDFGDAQELGILGEHTLGLWIPAQPSRQSSLIGRIVVKAACKFCDFLTDWEEKMFSHIQSFHMGEFFRTLTYEELRSRVPSLPAEIYKCGYCPAYTPSDDLKNLTSTIIKHLEVCPKVPRGSGPIKRKFGRITDVDEIRRNVLGLRGLPLVHGCNVDNVCTFEVAEDGEGDKRMDHLIKNHRTALYQFR